MNTHALSRTVRSLYFRRRLSRAIYVLEGAIRGELISRGTKTALVDGFLVNLDGENLSIKPLKRIAPGQLLLPGLKRSPKEVK